MQKLVKKEAAPMKNMIEFLILSEILTELSIDSSLFEDNQLDYEFDAHIYINYQYLKNNAERL